MPHKSGVAPIWRTKKAKYNLVGSICKECNTKYFPPVPSCNSCNKKTGDYFFNGLGEIVSYTVIHTGPEGFEKHTPYTIALIKLGEGPVLSAQIVENGNKVEIGKKVKVVFRKNFEDGEGGLIHYSFKFEIIQ